MKFMVQISDSDGATYVVNQLVQRSASEPYYRGEGTVYVDRKKPNPDSRLLAAVKTLMSAESNAQRWM